MSGVVGTLDPAGRRLLLIPRRPAPETLAPAPVAESEPGAAGKDRAAAGGEAKAAEEASGKLGAGAWWRLVAGGGRTGRGWGFVVRLRRRHHHAARAPVVCWLLRGPERLGRRVLVLGLACDCEWAVRRRSGVG